MPETAWMLLGIGIGFMLREYLPVRLPPTVSERERQQAPRMSFLGSRILEALEDSERERGLSQPVETAVDSAK